MIYLNITTTITVMQQKDKNLLKNFGKHLKKLRTKYPGSLNSFTFEKGGTTSASLSRIENGLVDFKFTTLVKISKALEISLTELFKDFDYEYDLDD